MELNYIYELVMILFGSRNDRKYMVHIVNCMYFSQILNKNIYRFSL